MLAGLIGSLFPMLPGPPLILLGAFVYAWHTDFIAVTWLTLLTLVLLTLLSQALDHIASMFGAKKFGATWWGMSGAFLGGLIGLFLGGIPGILIGPFLGALILEFLHGQGLKLSVKIGFGTLLGLLASSIGKFIISVTMIGAFCIKIIN